MRRLPPVLKVGGALAVLAAAAGLLLGLRSEPLSETDAISRWAADYAAETGRAVTDCAAAPDPREGVWIVVRCGSGPAARVYPLDRSGRLILPDGGGPST